MKEWNIHIRPLLSLILAEAMQSAGVRAFVGKLSMDISSRPTYVEASAEASLSSAKSFVDQCRHMMEQVPPHQRRIEPVLTPRFVPTCSDELLGSLGDLSRLESLRVQSHLAEAHDQVEWVRSVRGAEDIDIFDRVSFLLVPVNSSHSHHLQYNLLNPRTVQAHCTFLKKPDLSRMVAAGSSIAHCPLSNVYFSTEPFPLREALSLHVKVGLGTDIAGGYSIDIMNAMRHAVAVSRIRESSVQAQHEKDTGDSQDTVTTHKTLAIDWKESLYLATRGGAEALTLPAKSGTFEVGSFFDAQLSQCITILWITSN
jgi:guanine deaminase